MSGVRVSVAEAAQILGVHPQRVHQRIRQGSLPAEKVGNQWVIEMSDLRRVRHQVGPGRPLSAKSAWDLLAVAADDQVAAGLSPSARSRARSRLRDLLLVQASSAGLGEVSARLAHALRNRAERVLFVASNRDLPDVREDVRVHLSGVSLPESNMSGGVVEGYVSSRDVGGLVEDYLLSPADHSRANVIFHVVASEAPHSAMAALDEVARSPLALAADLAEYDGDREKNEAIRLLADLHARFGMDEAPRVGVDHG